METSSSICGRFIHYGYKLACREKVEGIFGDVAVAAKKRMTIWINNGF